MIATDPLSILFIICFLAGLAFVAITALLGHGHGGWGHHTGHGVLHHTNLAGGHIHAGGQPATSAHGVSTHTSSGHGTLQHTTAGQHNSNTAHHTPGLLSFVFAILNPMSIAFFLLGFGFFGYVFRNTTTNLALPLMLTFASISGLVIAAFLLILVNRLFDYSASPNVKDVADRTGLLGKVNITIQENGIGEIIYTSPGGLRKSIPARSVDGRKIDRDQEVVVVNFQQGVAEVDTWDRFSEQVEEENTQDSFETTDVEDIIRLRSLLDQYNTENSYVMRQEMQKE